MAFSVSSGLFRLYEAEEAPGWRVQLSAQGSGFVHRAVPLQARVGDVPVEEIFIFPGGDGFTGVLVKEPPQGTRLFVRYASEEEVPTAVTYGSDVVA